MAGWCDRLMLRCAIIRNWGTPLGVVRDGNVSPLTLLDHHNVDVSRSAHDVYPNILGMALEVQVHGGLADFQVSDIDLLQEIGQDRVSKLDLSYGGMNKTVRGRPGAGKAGTPPPRTGVKLLRRSTCSKWKTLTTTLPVDRVGKWSRYPAGPAALPVPEQAV